jgi:hypothetical protein
MTVQFVLHGGEFLIPNLIDQPRLSYDMQYGPRSVSFSVPVFFVVREFVRSLHLRYPVFVLVLLTIGFVLFWTPAVLARLSLSDFIVNYVSLGR